MWFVTDQYSMPTVYVRGGFAGALSVSFKGNKMYAITETRQAMYE
jgi:hypothetical protein